MTGRPPASAGSIKTRAGAFLRECRVKGSSLIGIPPGSRSMRFRAPAMTFADDRLTRAAEIDELSVVIGEDMDAIGRQHATDKWMARVDRRLREPRQTLDCLSNGRHLHLVLASKRGQDVKLGEVQERDECRRTRRRNVDERQIAAPANRPVADRGPPAPRGSAPLRRSYRLEARVGRSLHRASLGRAKNGHLRCTSPGRM